MVSGRNLVRRAGCVGVLLAVATVVPAQNLPEFPQFRNASGLPGGLFGVSYEGRPTIKGAMAISTPIGYGLGNGYYSLGLAVQSRDRRLRFPTSGRDTEDANSTLSLMGGFGLGNYGSLTISGMFLSSRGDSVLNLQYAVPTNLKGLGVSVGVQNVFDRPHARGDRQPGEKDLSRSFFVAATYEALAGTYLTLGKGDVRWKGIFGSASVPIGDRVRATAEYDTFGWNYGVAIGLGSVYQVSLEDELRGRSPRVPEFTLSLGFIKQNRIFWGVNVSY